MRHLIVGLFLFCLRDGFLNVIDLNQVVVTVVDVHFLKERSYFNVSFSLLEDLHGIIEFILF